MSSFEALIRVDRGNKHENIRARSGDSGTSVSLYDNTALIGASWDDEYTSTDSGSVYIFSRAPSTVNAFVTVWTEETKLRASDATEHALVIPYRCTVIPL